MVLKMACRESPKKKFYICKYIFDLMNKYFQQGPHPGRSRYRLRYLLYVLHGICFNNYYRMPEIVFSSQQHFEHYSCSRVPSKRASPSRSVDGEDLCPLD